MLTKSKKRIAKNTLMLYFRMILIMCVSLYTSRVVLNVLGVTDYGVYNVVGGVVSLLGFFNSSIRTSTQRFLNVEMAHENGGNLQTVFSTAVNVHAIIGIVTVILLETVGLWFVQNKLIVPPNRLYAALWVYQCSIFSFFISIISAPYSAAIIAYEKMSAFALISIIEAILQLSVALAIKYSTGDRLVLYALLLLGTTIIMRLIYSVYCSKSFGEIKYRWTLNIMLIKEMMSFSGWMIFGCVADLLGTQGVNMMINIFFGPVYNAARAIAMQVRSAVGQFSSNFIVSVNPQILKSYAAGDLSYSYRLVFTASKISFFLMLILIIPIMLRTPEILSLWLRIIPQDTSIFVNIILIEYLFRSSYTPIAQINQASGNIQLYQIAISSLYIVDFVASYTLFRIGFPAYSTFIVSASMAFVGLFVRLIILKYQQNFPAKQYLLAVTSRVLLIAVVGYCVCVILNPLLPGGLVGILALAICSSVVCISLVWIWGLDRAEKFFLKEKIAVQLAKLRSS